MFRVLYYNDDPLFLLNQIKRILKPSSKLVILSSNQLYFRFGKLFGTLPGIVPHDINERCFCAQKIVELVKKAGFEQIYQKGFGVIPIQGMEFLDETFLHAFGFVQLVTGIKKTSL